MPFHFRLHDPPCDVAFLSIVDDEALYNADHARTRDVKEATIRQIGWHRVDLPQDWFLSRQARDTTTHVLEAMQCTVQYLKHCAKNEEKRAQKAAARLRRCEEERAAAFEELIELRETLALYKRQLRELGQSTRPSRASPTRQGEAGVAYKAGGNAPGHLQCSFCENAYPSPHALESHFRKRHKRTVGYATMAAASAAVAAEQQRQAQLAPATALEATTAPPPQRTTAAGLPFMLNRYAGASSFPAATPAAETRGDRSLREEVSELRLAVARLVEQQAELHRGLSPMRVAAVPLAPAADTLSGLMRTTATGALPGLPPRDGRATEEDILLRIQRELLHTGAELQQLQSAVEAESAGRVRDAELAPGYVDSRDTDGANRLSSSAKSTRGGGGAAARAAPRLNPQSFMRTPTGTDGSDGPAERRRPSIADSLVVVSPITPPAGGGARAQARGVPSVPPISGSNLRGTSSGPGACCDTQRPATVSGTVAGPHKRSGSTSSGMGPRSSGGSGSGDHVRATRGDFLTPQMSPSGTTPDSSSTGSRSVAEFGTTVPGTTRQPGVAAVVATPPETPQFVPPSPSIGSLVLLPGGRGGAGGTAETSRRGSNGVEADRYGGPQSDEALSWTSGGLFGARPLATAAAAGLLLPEGAAARGAAAAPRCLPTPTDATPSPNLTAAEMSAYAVHGATPHGAGADVADGAAPHRGGSLDSSDGTWASVHLPASRHAAAAAAPLTPVVTPATSDSFQAHGAERGGRPSDSLSGPREGTPPTTRLAPVAALQRPDGGPGALGSPAGTAAGGDGNKPPRSTSPFLGHTLQRTHTEVRGTMVPVLVLGSSSSSDDDSGFDNQPSRTVAPSGPPHSHIAGGQSQESVPSTAVSTHGLLPASKVIPVVRLVPEALPSGSGELPHHGSLKRQVTSDSNALPEASSASTPPPLGLDDSLAEAVPPPPQHAQLPQQPSSRRRSSGESSGSEGSRGGGGVRRPPRSDAAVADSPASFSMNVPIFSNSDVDANESRTVGSAEEDEEPRSVPLDLTTDEGSDEAAEHGGNGGFGVDDPVMEDFLTDDGQPSSAALGTDTLQRGRGTQLAVFVRPGSPGVAAWGGAPPAAARAGESLPRTPREASVDTPSRAGTPDDASLTGDYSYYTYSESAGEAVVGNEDAEDVEARHAAAEVAAVARGKQTLQVSPMTSVSEVHAAPVPEAVPVKLQMVTPLASVETQAAPAKGVASGRGKKSHRGGEENASAAQALQGSSSSASQTQGEPQPHSAEAAPALQRRNSSSLIPQRAVQKTKTLFSNLFKSKGEPSSRKDRK